MDQSPADITSDHNFLQNEKFDFDLPFSPTLTEQKPAERNAADDEDEVFFGPVGFTEQCMSTRVSNLQDKPLTGSPLSGEQVVEIFTEATKIALHIERLSAETLERSLNQSHASSTKSSRSNCYGNLRLSHCSSSSGLSVGKLSSGSSEGKHSQSDLVDNDKENVQSGTSEKTVAKDESKRKVKVHVKEGKAKDVEILGVHTPGGKSRGNLPRPGSRSSKLPKSKNTEKSFSAFSSPIKVPDHAHQDAVTRSSDVKKQSTEKSARRRSRDITQKNASESAKQDTGKTRNGTSTALAKRNIFRSMESLNVDEFKDSKLKLPVPEQSKIPGPKPRRRRSSSTSSASSQSSSSSSKSQPAQDEGQRQTRPSKQIPSTKASLASSLPLGLIRRSKLHESSSDKKPQPIKALPRSVIKSSNTNSSSNNKNNNNTDQSSSLPQPRHTMRPPSDEAKDDKVPLPATPQSQSSLPVARRRSSIKRPSVSSARSVEGSPRRRSSSVSAQNQTPRKTDQAKKADATTLLQKRRSLIRTPGRHSESPSVVARVARRSADAPPLLSLSPALNHKKDAAEGNDKKDDKSKNVPNDDQHARKGGLSSAKSIDDLLQLDDTVSIMSDVMPIQPKPVSQPDLIDLSGL